MNVPRPPPRAGTDEGERDGQASEEPARLMHITINRREARDALNRKSGTETEASGVEGREGGKKEANLDLSAGKPLR